MYGQGQSYQKNILCCYGCRNMIPLGNLTDTRGISFYVVKNFKVLHTLVSST